ncbi:Precorrin-2 C20-methyltransferase [Roseomonas mucosa]|uniref:Precorrin-2 C(20)-methyltransferase n=1 Tax=Roseomonas mucosa TaxID=207340 RepID=A0A1S8D653_9PROT|nr:precorrin-2 C(20)-methyltransferase [Roseomonas mucosa]AWV22780.1 Precorrin-2 C20-methyltransferase [Roseomonas mucosa]MDT8278278.1 precorrin-2 C(20)-methyltransferase [Roseomonas mucosa]MDT8354174.1 precorrin-2 C(20)-methyltransferase [Roseomonas mucosa]MDU7522185.1 precorrin-2 C(20)-methyltransferase [Roseomonas mucosa]ONH83399.1 precorrin-2 C(20)-methyltransferase [Roseomonas mucosa]
MTALPAASGTLYTLGLGPGDPELLTLKAARILRGAPVFAHFAKRGRDGHARTIAAPHLPPAAEELRFEYPYTTEIPVGDPRYAAGIAGFYEDCAGILAHRLRAGQDVALLCEGDPFFYGSSMYLFDRLRGEFRQEVVPGITAMGGCWARTQTPVVHGDDILTVLPGTLDGARMAERLRGTDAAVIMKVGRNLPKIRAALEEADLTARALYVERGTMAAERIIPLAERDDAPAPYFSLVLVPGRQRVR